MKVRWLVVFMVPFLLTGCVSQANYNSMEQEKNELSAKLGTVTADLETAKKEAAEQAEKLTELDSLRSENGDLKQKLGLYQSASNPAAAAQSSNEKTTIEEEYINNLLTISDFQARYYDSILDGKVPGVTFKIKNMGSKSLSEIEATVYFKDADGKNIAEETYYPVSEMGFDYKELKPNYTFQMDNDQFYNAKSVPKEWKAGNAEIVITGITFKDE